MNSPRLLAAPEFEKLVAIFRAEGHEDCVPAPALSSVAVLEEGDEIVALLVLQLVPHFEPLWMHPRLRGRRGIVERAAEKLIRLLEALLPRGQTYFAFSTSKAVEAITQRVGMTPLSWKVWTKETK